MVVETLSRVMGCAARASVLALGVSAFVMSSAVSASAEGKVAGVFAGPITDKGFAQFTYEAMKDEVGQSGFDFAYTDSVAPSSIVETLRGYARSVDPKIKFLTLLTGDFNDPAIGTVWTGDNPRRMLSIAR